MTCPDCESRLKEALRVLRTIAGTAEATKQRDGVAYLQGMAREALRKLEALPPHPSMAPTERPQTRSSE